MESSFRVRGVWVGTIYGTTIFPANTEVISIEKQKDDDGWVIWIKEYIDV